MTLVHRQSETNSSKSFWRATAISKQKLNVIKSIGLYW